MKQRATNCEEGRSTRLSQFFSFFSSCKSTCQPRIVVLLLAFFLSSCWFGPRSWVERDAPESGKTYVLTEEMVLTSEDLLLPGLLRPEQTTRQIMTPEYYALQKQTAEGIGMAEEYPYPDEGRVEKGTRLEVDQVFTYSDFNASVRYGRGRLDDPERGPHTVYLNLDDWAGNTAVLELVR